MKKLLSLSLLLAAALFPAALSAKTFEGTIQMTITDGRNKAMPMAYSIKGHLIRTDVQVDHGINATAILDFSKNEMIMLMPSQPMYMVMPLQGAAEAATGHKADDVTLEKTAITEKILGYTCTKYLAKSQDSVTEIWATEELGSFQGLGGAMGKTKATPSWEKALVGKNFFPLRVVASDGQKTQFRMEATAVQAKTLPASHFAPPEGYRKFDMGGMMQGLPGMPGSR